MNVFFLRGLVIGFSIAAPVGPIGLLCIRRTLAEGRLAGLVTGLGAATADAIYGAVAGFGLTAVSAFLVREQTWLRLAGGLFLIYLGIRAAVAAPAAVGMERLPRRSLVGAYAATLALTLTNPLTIVSFAAIFAGLGVVAAGSYASATALVVGVFTGSTLWWVILSAAASGVRRRLEPQVMRWVNRAAGLVIAGVGAAALLSLR